VQFLQKFAPEAVYQEERDAADNIDRNITFCLHSEHFFIEFSKQMAHYTQKANKRFMTSTGHNKILPAQTGNHLYLITKIQKCEH
jgi:hypothetical protein